MIHQYSAGDHNIVLDVNSGAIHSVSQIAYAMIPQVGAVIQGGLTEASQIEALFAHVFAGMRMNDPATAMPNGNPFMQEAANAVDTMEAAVAEILSLYEKGQLFSPDTMTAHVAAVKQRPAVIKAMCLHVAHACNLSCRYCFADAGAYLGEQALMSPETGRQAMDFLVASSGSRKNLEVDFFGGEPLLNWELIKELVAYGRGLEEKNGKKFRFTLTTNGLLLDEGMFDFINREMANVVLSIDGRKPINDNMRKKPDGSGSYDDVINKFKRLAAAREHKNYYIRGTFTRHNLDFSKDFRHLADLGFRYISLEPAVGAGKDFHIRPADINSICAEYDRLLMMINERHAAGKPAHFFHFMLDLSGGPCLKKRLIGCGAGAEYVAITPAGEIYPCHQFVGRGAYKMGSLAEGITNAGLRDKFLNSTLHDKAHCRDCFAQLYCSGGCHASAELHTGNILEADEVSCSLQKKRLECAIMLKVMSTEREKS